MNSTRNGLISAILSAACLSTQAGDWNQWGRTASNNFYSPEKGITHVFEAGDFKSGTEEIDITTTKNVKWVAKLGSQAYGNVTVADGRVYVGTNNESFRDPKHKGDRGIVFCLEEKTGRLNWQLVVPKLGAGKVSDWEFLGICSSPSVDGDKVYVVSNRCEILCLDAKGLSNGNDGFKDEAQYMAGSGKAPITPGATDADILWIYDMREELGIFPHNIASSSVLVVGNYVYATTSNGQDWSHLNIPSPMAPCLVVLDKNTGEYVGEEASGISKNLMHCNWSSPGFGNAKGRPMVFFGAGDGVCYAFNPEPKPDGDFAILEEVWKYDCVPEKYKLRDGKPIKYPDAEGPSELISSPVFYKDRVYIAIGQDPEHGEGVGNLVCIDATKKGDITKDGALWTYEKINRTISTASIDPESGLLFMSDYSGFVYCLDAETGEEQWIHDMKAHMWGSTLVADGKVFLGDEDGDLVVLAATREKKLLTEVYFGAPIYSTPVAANGTLYVGTQTHLYAIGK
ncbi:MAG: PQQ-binding-like beta-propeller repeat protein [Verrucomicrobiota bacterium]|jgi:outer membrane protein assembly factor BamB|nr:PQQ-binding-like beta-propeller repeat protein [Verrucomicrobiota bacterium]